jgi:hypothetical protein
MYHKGRIITGLAVFVVLAVSPVWYNIARWSWGAKQPELALPENETQCVEDVAFMRCAHMDLLEDWRERVVRDGERTYVSKRGVEFDMSLSNTCLNCHSSKQDFCDACHNYAGVEPYCWACHTEGEEQ